jgi:hypothetical protein
MKNFYFVSFLALALFACNDETPSVEPIQKGDKQLSCEEILFEINDSEFYKKQAQEKKGLGIKSIVMPLGYIDTYMSADEAIAAANQRIEYLKRIYDIRNCEAAKNQQSTPPQNNNPAYNYQPQPQFQQPQFNRGGAAY